MTNLTRDKLVEIIARAIYEAHGQRLFDEMSPTVRNAIMVEAAAALAAIAEHAAIVPRETILMNAICDGSMSPDQAALTYAAMVEASDLSRPAHEEPAELSQ